MSDGRTVSVVIPTFNGEKYIQATLDSIANQSVAPNEVIISDDNSSDRTIAVARECGDLFEFFKIVHGNREGISKNYLNALDASTGDIIVVGDQDDPWRKDKLEQIVNTFDSRTDVTLFSSDSVLVDQSLNELGDTLRGGVAVSERLSKAVEKDDFIQFIKGLRLDAHTLSFRESVKSLVTSPALQGHNNIWFEEKVAIAALCLGRLVYRADALTLYRQHKNQHTHKKSDQHKEQVSRQERLHLMASLLEDPHSLAVIDDVELKRRKQLLEDYLVFLSHRSTIRPSLATSLNYLFRGTYARYNRRGFLSFCKDISKSLGVS